MILMNLMVLHDGIKILINCGLKY